MGKRDYRQRETKKQKKDPKKLTPFSVTPSAGSVEVIGNSKKKREAEEEEIS